ncbi:MAG: chalcone isomerase family protein [Terriglobales bacterium]
MKLSLRLFAVLVFVLAATLELRPAELAGINLPDTAQTGTTKLVLNGLGLRKKYMVKVYVAGLYIERKSSDPRTILRNDAPKRVVMQFVRDVSKQQLTDAFEESFRDNTPQAAKTVRPDIDRFLGALEPVHNGDQIVFTYIPGQGTTFALNGHEKLAIATPLFAEVLWSVWLGPKPPSADLQKGMLGQ